MRELRHKETGVHCGEHQAALHGAVSLYLLTRALLGSGLHVDSQGIFPSCCFGLGFVLLFVFMMAWVASCRSYLPFCNHAHVLPDLAKTRKQGLILKGLTRESLIFRKNLVSLSHEWAENLSFTKHTPVCDKNATHYHLCLSAQSPAGIAARPREAFVELNKLWV